jgi:serine/threonine protein kinase
MIKFLPKIAFNTNGGIFRCMMQACLAVKYLHGYGILHLDIKPLNMLIDEKTENLKLCDFGNSALKHKFGKYQALARMIPINF